MKKAKASSKDVMHPMLHGQHDGKMPKHLMVQMPKKKTAKMKKK